MSDRAKAAGPGVTFAHMERLCNELCQTQSFVLRAVERAGLQLVPAAPPTAGGGEGKHNDFCDSRELSPLLGPSEKPCNCGAIVEKPEPPKLPLPIGHEFVGCGLGSLDPRVESVSSHRNWCHALGCGQPLTAHEER